MRSLHLRFLGGFAATVDPGTPAAVDLTAPLLVGRVPQLLALIAARDAQVSRDKAAATLWPDAASDAQALTNLRKVLHVIRKAAPDDDFFAFDGAALGWRAGADVRSDLKAFRTALAGADWAAATAVYGGELLPGAVDEWVLLERERLRQQQVAALAAACDASLASAAFGDAAAQAHALIAFEPLDESACVRLMHARAMLGDRAGVARAFRDCESRLRDELGVAPADATRRAYRRFLAVDITRLVVLPDAPTPFVGRARELADVAVALRESRLTTLLGPGGCGKTRLALEAARRASGRFIHGIVFVDCMTLRDAGDLAAAICAALNAPISADPESQLRAHLAERQVLLLLDNVETVLPASALLAGLLDAAPELCCLVASREALQLRRERVVLIDGMSAEDARELLCAMARRSGVSADVLADVEAQHRLCDAVHGLPLAIEMAAAQLLSRSAHELAHYLQAGLSSLSAPWRDVPERQRSLRATFDYSWQRLSESERAAFRRLCVFRGPFTTAAAAAVAQANAADVRALAVKSLLQPETDGRSHIHPALRAFGEGALDLAGEREALERAHAAFFAGCLREVEPHLYGAGERAAFLAQVFNRADVLMAFERCIALGDMDEALIQAMGQYVSHAAHLPRGAANVLLLRACEAWQAVAVAAADAAGASRARVLWFQYAHASGRLDHASRAATQSELASLAAAFEQAGDHAWLGRARTLWAWLHLRAGDYAQASGLYEQASAAYERCAAGQPVRREWALRWTADACNQMGNCAEFVGDYVAAERHFARSAALARALGSDAMVAVALNNQGLMAQLQGDYSRALELLEEARARSHSADYEHGRHLVGIVLAWCQAMSGDDRAEETALDAEAGFERLENWPDLGMARNILGFARLRAGRFAAAEAALQDALAVWRREARADFAALTHALFGELYLATGKPAAARAALQQALTLALPIGAWLFAAQALACCCRLPGLPDGLRADINSIVRRHPAVPAFYRAFAPADAPVTLPDLDAIVQRALVALDRD